jgi:hypothetical protein
MGWPPGPGDAPALPDAPPAPSSLNGHLSPAIDAVLLRALAKQPDERFPSVTPFARAFHEAVQSDGELHATLAISRAEAESGTTRTLTLPGGRQVSVTVPGRAASADDFHLSASQSPAASAGQHGPHRCRVDAQRRAAFSRGPEHAASASCLPQSES